MEEKDQIIVGLIITVVAVLSLSLYLMALTDALNKITIGARVEPVIEVSYKVECLTNIDGVVTCEKVPTYHEPFRVTHQRDLLK